MQPASAAERFESGKLRGLCPGSLARGMFVGGELRERGIDSPALATRGFERVPRAVEPIARGAYGALRQAIVIFDASSDTVEPRRDFLDEGRDTGHLFGAAPGWQEPRYARH
jgi:hypothetical protein